MFALGIRYLNGFAAACEPEAREPGRERAEWPPHPARVFMALVAAHFETGADPAEREALLWLEGLPPPSLKASAALQRAAVTHYVPVNDKAGDASDPPTAIIQSAPQLARDRQPRSFARAWLDDDVVYLVWTDAVAPEPVAQALEALSAKVTRIGHSISLVQMWLAGSEEVGEVNWIPDDERAELQLRVVGPGTLVELERCYNGAAVDVWTSLVLSAEDDSDKRVQRAARKRLKEEFGDNPPPRLRPQIALYQGYARPVARDGPVQVRGSVFSPHLVVFALERRSGPYVRLGLRSVAQMAERWREALVSQANDMPDRVREVVSGHAAGGGPLEGPHLAFVPMAFVGDLHADGHLLGVAVALPEDLAPEDRRQVLRVIGRVHELKLGPLGVWELVRDLGERPAWNLRAEAWTAHPDGATHWATVTPVAFDRHPKEKDRVAYQREAAGMIAGACEAVGLPRPREVIVTPVSAHLGVPPAFEFPRLKRKDGTDRRHAHAILIFDRPVVGPVLIGAGRYRGYGVCRPLES
ncbi:MAG TPA: type I-U CRISPR-associated protein Csb2 [Vicinamibacterales bacterium]|nr:type I-U CRISPR-associated protein Csb2 [Vicinamibacterales bacterium]